MPSPQANDTPWWFHPGSQMLLCFTPKRNHSIITQCSVRGILAFRRGVVPKGLVTPRGVAQRYYPGAGHAPQDGGKVERPGKGDERDFRQAGVRRASVLGFSNQALEGPSRMH